MASFDGSGFGRPKVRGQRERSPGSGSKNQPRGFRIAGVPMVSWPNVSANLNVAERQTSLRKSLAALTHRTIHRIMRVEG